jgi:hypothetical protein
MAASCILQPECRGQLVRIGSNLRLWRYQLAGRTVKQCTNTAVPVFPGKVKGATASATSVTLRQVGSGSQSSLAGY